MQSETIGKLAEALAKAQAVMEGASKSSANPFFKSKYADLASVWDACRKPLSDNGLSVTQTCDFIPENPEMVVVVTTLMHSSGEFISGRLAAKPVKQDPQGVGSTITYLCRYSLQSIVGIAPEDDDGNAASGLKDTSPAKAKAAPAKEDPAIEKPRYLDGTKLATVIDMIVSKKVDLPKFLRYMSADTCETILAVDYDKAINALKAAKGGA